MRNRRDLTGLLSVPPLAVLPWIETQADRRSHVVVQRYTLAGTFAAMAVAVLLVHFFYRPLDVLWQVALRWAGI